MRINPKSQSTTMLGGLNSKQYSNSKYKFYKLYWHSGFGIWLIGIYFGFRAWNLEFVPMVHRYV